MLLPESFFKLELWEAEQILVERLKQVDSFVNAVNETEIWTMHCIDLDKLIDTGHDSASGDNGMINFELSNIEDFEVIQ